MTISTQAGSHPQAMKKRGRPLERVGKKKWHTRAAGMLLGCLLACLAASPLAAQRVTWGVTPPVLELGRTQQLPLIFENTSPVGEVQLPEVGNLEVGPPSRSLQTTVINGRMTRQVVLQFPVIPTSLDPVLLPDFMVETEDGLLTVPARRFEVDRPGVGANRIPLEEVVTNRLRATRRQVWAGEVFPLEYLIISTNQFAVSLASEPVWSPAGLLHDPWDEPQRREVSLNQVDRPALLYRSMGMFSQPGTRHLSPVRQRVSVNLERGRGLFQMGRSEEYTLDSNSLAIEVQPLPEGAPPEFRGAVGSFELEGTIVPDQVRVGEPITWNLVLRGEGNWPSNLRMPGRRVPANLEVVAPPARFQQETGSMFSGSLSEELILIPNEPGQLRLAAIRLAVFDPAAGEYTMLEVPETVVTVLPAPAGPRDPVPPESITERDRYQPPQAWPGTPLPTPSLPRAPLPGADNGRLPGWMPGWGLFAAGLLPGLLLWPILALRQAWRRSAYVRWKKRARMLKETVRSIELNHGQARQAEFVFRWQRLVRDQLGISLAVPHRSDIESALRAWANRETVSVLGQLWQEAEDSLYREDHHLPEDWVERVSATRPFWNRPPGHLIRFPLRRDDFLCWMMAGGFFLMTLPAYPSSADEALNLYGMGEFEEAIREWREILNHTPQDWIARMNLGTALGQADRGGEAYAATLSSFVLRPTHPDVRWNLALWRQQAPAHQAFLDKWERGSLPHRLAGRFSPGHWTGIALLATTLTILGFAGSIWLRYMAPSWIRLRRIIQTFTLVGMILYACARLAISSWGLLANPEALILLRPVQLHSLPSDIIVSSLSPAIPPGAVVKKTGSFLGWIEIELPNGEIGWLREEYLFPLYGAPDPPADPIW